MSPLVTLLQLALLISSCDGLSVTASFNQRGVSGNIIFNQTAPEDSLHISVELNGLSSNPTEWAIHSFPFIPSDPLPCQLLVGPQYHDLSTDIMTQSEEVQTFSDSNLTLFGRDSIIGRSLLIKVDEDITVCSTIGYASVDTLLWAPFRDNDIASGNVFLWQHTNQSLTSILVNLTTTLRPPVVWSILSGEDNECNDTVVYNTTAVEGVACSHDNWIQCAVGDLSGRNGNLSVGSKDIVQQFVSDPGLPLDQVKGLQLALKSEEKSVCAVLQRYLPVEAMVEIHGAGVGGMVKFTQPSPLEDTQVVVTGLEGVEYSIHTFPPATGRKCSNTGDIFDPRGVGNITLKNSLDSYPFGNLSGKFNGSQTYSDPYLPLSGRDSVIGRALVVTNNDGCGLIQHAGDVVEMKATISAPGFSGTITFTQPADNPFADTVITIEINITADVEVFTSSTDIVSIPLTSSFISTSPSIPSSSIPLLTPVYITPSQSSAGRSASLSFSMDTLETSIPTFLPFPTPSLASSPSTPYPDILFPFSTLLGPDGSGFTESSVLLEPTMSVGGTQRRKKRAAAAAKFGWSLRQWDGSALPDDCSQLHIIGSSTSTCSPDNPLSCAAGDLSGKHGPILFGVYRAVIHDPYLPLSGLNGVFSTVLHIQPANGVGPSVCVAVTEVTMTTTTIPTPQMTSASDMASASPPGLQTAGPSSTATATTSPPTPQRTGIDTTALIGAVVGGVVGAGLLLALVLLVMCVCLHRLRSGRVDLSKQGKRSDTELGLIRPHVEPQIGSDQYRAVCPYQPHQSGTDDLPLEKGEWVTLLEAPYGGEWWRGQASAGEGWFPKTYVEYVDREAERKKAEEDNFKLAAAAIVAASSSFSLRHGSLATTKTKAITTNTKRSTTFSKSDIISTPLLTSKVHVPPSSVVVVKDTTTPSSPTSSSRPDTPYSLGGSDVIVNHVAMDTGTSQESSDSNQAERILHLEPYLAKYNYVGGTEIELPLRKGEVVSVIEKAASGWWQGVCGGKVGWFPASYVKPAVTEEQKKEERQDKAALLGMEESLRLETLEATEYRAIDTFSSDQEGDLPFVKGDSVLVYWVHDSGWWYGSSGTMQGWFPRTYVEPSMEGSEAGSVVTSPVPQPEEGAVEVAVSSGESKSPAQRKRKRKWSFKRTKSQEIEEGGHSPLIEESEEYRQKKRQPSKPRRRAPPPPTTESSPPQVTRATPPPLATPSHTELNLATTSDGTSTQQPLAMKRNHRTTASGVDSHKPRRLPPPPPSQTTPQTPPTITETVAEAMKPPSGNATPVAPPRRKPRIKRVKRPSTRLIPPPPNIPLPLPPSRPTAASPVAPSEAKLVETTSSPQGTALTTEPSTAVEGAPAAGEGPEVADVREQAKRVTTPAVKTKPPVKPKPAHLSKRATEPSLTLSTTSSALTSQPPPIQASPKPAPPTRRSSLPAQHLPPAKPREPSPHLANTIEETDSPQQQDTAEAVRNLRSAPPQHPPPLRPEADDSTTRGSQKRRSNPPSFPPPQRPDIGDTATTQQQAIPGDIDVSRSSSIKTRGTQLMRSLKKIVQRSDSKEEGEEPEQRSKVKVQEGEVIQNLQTDSPVPHHRQLPDESAMSPPARPPPPHLARTGSGDHKKVTPSRPPPPRKQSFTASANGTTISPPAHPTPQSLPASSGSSPAHSATSPSRSTSPQLPTNFYRAKSDYTAQSASELTFHIGDILVEIDRPTSVMSYGMLDDGTTGLFPANAVEPVITPSHKK